MKHLRDLRIFERGWSWLRWVTDVKMKVRTKAKRKWRSGGGCMLGLVREDGADPPVVSRLERLGSERA